MPARRVRPRALVAATVLALGAGLLGAAPAQAAAIGTITGSVTGTDDVPLGDWPVTLQFDHESLGWIEVSWGGTDGNGDYTFVNLEPGSYRIHFEDDPGYVGEYWDDASDVDDATEIVVSEENTTHVADAQLSPPGRITGTVTGAGNLPLEGVDVTAYTYVEDEDYWQEVASATTDADGDYDLDGLRTGTYRVGFDEEFDGTYIDEFWEDSSTVELATDIEVEAGETTGGISPRLTQGGHITGTITDVDGQALPDIEVTAYRYDVYGDGWEQITTASTDSNGVYDLNGLATDDYRVEFRDSWGDLLPEFYDDVPTLTEAVDVPVAAGATTDGIDALMTYGGGIAGTVTGGGGPLEEIDVNVYRYDPEDDDWSNIGDDLTGADGSYSVGGLHSGTYRVQFRSEGTGFVGEYWDDAPDQDSSDQVVVVEGETTEEIDADLARTGGVSGTVTDSNGGALEGVLVTAYQHRDEWGWENVGRTVTDADGEYLVEGLPPGDVRLGFYDGSGPFLEEYWEDAPTRDEADDVTVVSGETTPVGTAELELSGSVTGRVTDPDGQLLEAVYVTLNAYDPEDDDWDFAGSYQTGTNGRYEFKDIAAGTYRIRFESWGSGLLPEYWKNASSLETATDVVLAPGGTVDLPDAALDLGGQITGTVTGPDDPPVGSIEVKAYRWREDGQSWEHTTGGWTDGSGNYTLRGLETGTYRVEFDTRGAAYADQWWDGADTRDDAEDIAVVAGRTVDGIDAELALGGRLSGTLTTTGGEPATDIWVRAFLRNPSTGSWDSADNLYTYTDDDGWYDLDGLTAGTYRLQFGYEWGDEVIGEYWNDAATLEEADDIELEAGEARELDAVLASSGGISGKVTGPGGRGVVDVDVDAYRWFSTDDGGYWSDISGDTTSANGRYEITGLPTGTYRLRFEDDYGRDLATEWWDDAASAEHAEEITVQAGETTTGKNAQLGRAGHIAGIVTDEQGRALTEVQVVAHELVGGTWQEVEGADDGTNSTGRYDLGNLPPGTYRLGFFSWDGDHVAEYWDDSLTVAGADDIEVVAGRTAGARDAQLARAGHLRGRVTAAGGGDLNDIDVTAFMRVGGTWQEVAEQETSPDGEYEIDGLVPGTYRLRFVDDEEYGYATEFWDDAATLARATDITVTPGNDDAQYDAELEEPLDVANTGLPTISGTTRVGATLTASPGTWTPGAGLTFEYQWRVGGTDVGGATGSTYVPTAGDLGKPVSVTVTAYAGSRGSASATSTPTAAVVAAETPAVVNATLPTISGAVKVGSTVTATPGAWTPADAVPSYQWLVGGAPVAGATSATYTPARDDAGKSLQVQVTATKTGYVAGSAVSAATPVAKATIALSGSSKLTGKVARGATLNVKPAKATTSGVTTKIQWFAGKKAIKKATGAKLTLSGATLKAVTGKKVTVRITYTATGHQTETVTLNAKGTIKPTKKGKGKR